MIRAWILIAALGGPAWAGPQWLHSFDAAKARAESLDRPILVDFEAAWCYSCYYMEEKVLGRAPFGEAAKALVLLKLDVDEEEGARLKKAYSVGFLPSYLILDAAGKELGRIIGEQLETDFMRQLEGILSKRVSGPAKRLNARLDANDLKGSVILRGELERERPELIKDRSWRLAAARLDLGWNAKVGRHHGAVAAFKDLMTLDDTCAAPYHVFRARKSLEALGDAKLRRSNWRLAQERLAVFVERRVFGKQSDRCADMRSGAQALAMAYGALGEAEARQKILGRMITMFQSAAKGVDPDEDRNLYDNLRYFLGLAGRDRELESLYSRLIGAFPNDYVYSYRFAKHLHGIDRFKEALPHIEKALLLSYGANRLSVAGLRARILAGLGRLEEARSGLAREIRIGRRRFPSRVVALEKILGELK